MPHPAGHVLNPSLIIISPATSSSETATGCFRWFFKQITSVEKVHSLFGGLGKAGNTVQLDFEKLEVKFNWHKTPKAFQKVDYANGRNFKYTLESVCLSGRLLRNSWMREKSLEGSSSLLRLSVQR